MTSFLAAFATIPVGVSLGVYAGRRYILTKTRHAGGRSAKQVAEALDGSDYISLNLYHLAAGARLRPCEMPAAKVRAFVEGMRLLPHP